MKCANCNMIIKDIHIYCHECKEKRNRLYLKSQIGLMARMAKETDDPADIEEIGKRSIQYLQELQDATL